MSKLIIDGKTYAKEIELDLKKRMQKIASVAKKIPYLATIIVGNNFASETYVKMKCNACERIGLGSKKVSFDDNAQTKDVLKAISKLNADKLCCGILLQHPTPKQINEQACFDAICLEKDVDGVNSQSFGKMAMGIESFYSATPYAIISLIKRYNISLSGKNVAVVGRSRILGKPVAMMLLNEDATVTICHSKTKNLNTILKSMDIVVACLGKPRFIKASMLKKGVVIIDAGYNKGAVGDVDLEQVSLIASAYTPVPGGVGPVTIAKLLEQSVHSAEQIFLKKMEKKL